MAGVLADCVDQALTPGGDQLCRAGGNRRVGERDFAVLEQLLELVQIVEVAQGFAQILELGQPDRKQFWPQRFDKVEMMVVMYDGLARFMEERPLAVLETLAQLLAAARIACRHSGDEQAYVALGQWPI